MGTYLVTGSRSYNDVPPGHTFEAVLDPAAEWRAVARGAIVVLDATPPGIVPGSYQPPPGWDTRHAHEEAPAGASLTGRSR